MRKILSLLIAVVLGVSTAFATTVYCKMTHSWWNADGAAIAVHYWGSLDNSTAWPGVRMTPVPGEEGTWSYDVPADVAGLIFVRVNGTGGIDYWKAQTADLSLPTDDKDLYTITSASAVWSNQGVVTGEWSKYAASEPVTPTLENGFYLIGKINGVEGWTAADLSADRKFAANPENPAEFVVSATLAVGDEIKVVNVVNDAITAWYPADGNYVVDAAHAGENKDIYFQPDYKADWVDFGGYFWTGSIEVPAVDFTKPFTLKFNGNGDSDNSNSFTVESGVAAIFDEASAPYVSALNTVSNVFSARTIADDPSSLKFGTSKKQGTLAFTIGQAIEVDSIIVNATQYSNNAAEVTVNGTKFDLTQGNKVPTDCKLTPEGEVSTITIAQTGSERIYLRYVKVYPKQAGEEPQPQGCDWDAIDFLGSTDPAYTNQFKVCKPENVGVVNIQQPGFATEIGIYMTFPSAAYGTISLPESAYDIQGAGIIFHLSAFTDAYTEVTVNCDGNDLVFTVYNANGGTPVEPTLANGFYLIGQNGWDVAALSADLLFAANPEAEGEHVLNTTLAAGQEIKVVKVENDAIVTWYPDGLGNAYTVDQNHAGATTIYFRPAGNAEWAAFGGFMYVVPTGTTGIDAIDANAPAVKVLRNGQLLIKKGDKTYNVMGAIVR